MKPYLIFFSFAMLTITSAAQRTEKFYDYQWRTVPVGKARFYSLIEKDGDRYHRLDYFIQENKLQMNGYYTDSNCNIKQGDFQYYHPNGRLEIKSSYVNNKLNGGYLSFYNNGMMNDSSFYSNGDIIGNSFGWHPDGTMEDSTVMNEDGSGVTVTWHDNGVPSSAGYFAPGRERRGTWQYFHYNGKSSAKEQYDKGKMIEKKYFDENGIGENDTASTDREVSFTGGSKAWMKYVSKHAYFPDGWRIVNTDAVVVVVSATINEEGKVTDAYVSSPFHPSFDQIALKMMRSSPRWIPAIAHHRKIKSYIRQPITFQEAE